MTDEEIADQIDAARDRWERASRLVHGSKTAMPADRKELQDRLMQLDALIGKYDLCGREIIQAAVDRAHNSMMRGGV
ncbi:hypothetical protein [Rhizobium phaseoli]|uniref:Uncharacterized protein n=1 Tax=Rhizobium phaseoli TaxID=396 RepID=A0ABM6C8X0_9HYPH|nr:hypothetical protein [Rhizobium phaseoli]ANL84653.1 hypothetical protein AMC81_CH01872 [Rhizobium phaseoli]ANL91160.1 hypothetical protein AMC80_CH01872 [Rhizobium phaseoli]